MPRSEPDFSQQPMRFSEFFLAEKYKDETGVSPYGEAMDNSWKYIESLEYDPHDMLLDSREGQYQASLIPHESGYAFGILPANIATSQAFADDYHRGIFTYNQAHSNLVAERIIRGRGGYEKDSIGHISRDTRGFLKGFLETKSNWVKGFGGGFTDVMRNVDVFSGFGWSMYEQPEDLFEIDQPGYSQDAMLEIMEDTNEHHLQYLKLKFGGEEGIKEMTKKARNSDHFFYLINEALDHSAVQSAIHFHSQQMEGIEEFWKLTALPFIRDGLLNDPDMPASITIGLATAGIGTAVGAAATTVFGVGRLASKVPLAGKYLTKGATWSSKVISRGTKVNRIVDFLPENIGLTAFKKFAPTLANSMIKARGVKGIVARSIPNVFEGGVEGGLAETINQTLKMERDLIDNYDIGRIWEEAKVEAVFSVVANPLIGGAMNLSVGLPMHGLGKVTGKLALSLPLGDRLRSSLRMGLKAKQAGSKNPIITAIEYYERGDEFLQAINNLRQTKGDEKPLTLDDLLNGPLQPLLDPFGIRDGDAAYDDVAGIVTMLQEIHSDSEGRKYTDDELVDQIALKVQEKLGEGAASLVESLSDITNLAKVKLRMAKYVQRYNKEHGTSETVETLLGPDSKISDEQLWDIYVDEALEEKVHKYLADKGIKWDSATATQKLEAVEEMEAKIEQQYSESQIKLLNANEVHSSRETDLVEEVEAVAKEIDKKEHHGFLTKFLRNLSARKIKKQRSKDQARREAEELEATENVKSLRKKLSSAKKKKSGLTKFLKKILSNGHFTVTANGKIRLGGKGRKVTLNKENVSTVEQLLDMGDMGGQRQAMAEADKVIENTTKELKEITTKEDTSVKVSQSNQQGQRNSRLRNVRRVVKKQLSVTTDKDMRTKLEKLITKIDDLVAEVQGSLEDWKAVEKENEEINKVTEQINEGIEKTEKLQELIKKVLGDDIDLELSWRNIMFVDGLYAGKFKDDPEKYKGYKLSKEDFTDEQWEFIITAINKWEPRKWNSKTKSKLQAQIKEGIIDIRHIEKLKLGLFKQQEGVYKNKLYKSQPYKDMVDLKKEMEGLVRKREGLLLRYAYDKAKKHGLASFQLKTIREILAYRKAAMDRVDSRRKALARRWKKNETITAEVLEQAYLQDGPTKRRIAKEEPDKTYTEEEATEIFEESAKERKDQIKRMKPGYFRDTDFYKMSKDPKSARNWGVNQTTDTPQLDRTNETAIEESIVNREGLEEADKPEGMEDMAYTLAEEIMALQETLAQAMAVLEGPWATEGAIEIDGETMHVVPIWVADSTLAPGIYDTSFVYLFRDSIVDENGEAVEGSPEDLHLVYDTLYIRMDKLSTGLARRIARANSDFQGIALESLDSLTKRIRDKNNPESRNGIYTMMAMTERMLRGSTSINMKLFRDHGFIVKSKSLSKDPVFESAIAVDVDENGKAVDPEAMKVAEQKFLDSVIDGMARGIRNTVNKRSSWKKDLYAHFDIPSDITSDTELARWLYTHALDTSEKEIAGTSIVEEDIISMGNGTKGWHAAEDVGADLIDFILVNDLKVKHVVTKNKLRPAGSRAVSDEAQYRDSVSGDDVSVEPMGLGESTLFAPERPESVALVWEDFIHRKRIHFALNEEIDDAFIAEYDEWRLNQIETAIGNNEPAPLALTLDPEVRLLPHLLNYGLDQQMIKRPELENVLAELLLNMPNIGYAFIQDSRFANNRFAYVNDAGKVVHGDLTTGEATVVPMSGISSILALEEMSPHLKGLTEIVIEKQINLEREFAANSINDYGKNYWESEAFWNDILDPKTYGDKKFNGLFVTKILSLTSEKAKKAMDELREGTNMSFEVPDYYIKAGLHFSKHIQAKAKEGNNELAPFAEFYAELESRGITTMAEYEDHIANGENDVEFIFQMGVMREFWKLPVMRTLYGGGYPMWINLWKEGGDGWKDIMPLFRELGFEIDEKDRVDGIPRALATFGEVLYKTWDAENQVVISAALGIDGLREKARELLSVSEAPTDNHVAQWVNTVQRWGRGELTKDNPTHKRDYLRRQMDLNVARSAKLQGMTEEQFRSGENGWDNRMLKAEEIIETAEREDRELTDDEHNRVMTILSGDRMSWKHNQFFFALNLQNSSGFKLVVEILRAQAATTGMRFNEKDLLGFENHILHHVFLPGLESYRTYSARSSLNRHHHNTMFARIQTDKAAFESFIANEITEADWQEPARIGKKIMKWAERPYRIEGGDKVYSKEGESPLGQQRVEDNPHFNVQQLDKKGKLMVDKDGNPVMKQVDLDDEAEVARWQKDKKRLIQGLMIRSELLMMATDDRPPVARYTAEDDMDALEAEFYDTWWQHSQEGQEDFYNAVRFQQEAARDSKGVPIESVVSSWEKGGGLFIPVDGRTIRFRGAGEHSASEIKQGAERSVTEASDNPRGFLSWVPQTRQMPFHNMGNLLLQQKTYRAMEKEFMEPVDEARAEIGQPLENPDHVIPTSARGFVKPWDRSTLPEGAPVTVDPLEHIMGLAGTQVGVVANMMEMQLGRWAVENGFEAEVNDPDMIPYLYLVYKLDKALTDDIEHMIRSIRFGDKSLSEQERLISSRNTYLDAFHSLFQLSRDVRHKEMHSLLMETKGNEIGILNPDMANMTLREILTSIYSENNPLAVLYGPTLIHKALKFGLVETEHFVLNPDDLNDGEAVDIRDIAVHPLLVQAHDLNQYLVEILWDHSLFEAVEYFASIQTDSEKKKKYGDISKVRTKKAWNKIDPEDKQTIIELAMENKKGAFDPITQFGFTVEHIEGRDDLVRLVAMNIEGKEGAEGKKIFRNAFGEGFSMLMRVPRNVIGANMKLGITTQGALLMLAAQENHPLLARLQQALHQGKAIRARKKADGSVEMIQSEAEELKDYFGYSMSQQIDKERIEGEAMEIVVSRAKDGAKLKHTLKDGGRKVGNVSPTIIDWINYYRTDSKGVTGKSFFVNAHTAPIRRAIRDLESGGLAGLMVEANPASKKIGFSENRIDKAKETLVALGLSEDVASSVIDKQSEAGWDTDLSNVISLDIETSLDGKDDIIGVGGLSQVNIVGGHRTFGKGDIFTPKGRGLNQQEALAILEALEAHLLDGGKVVTFNGNSFDLARLGEVAGNMKLAHRVGELSIDIMQLLLVSDSTFSDGVGEAQSMVFNLNNVAVAMGIEGKKGKGEYAALLKKRAEGHTVDMSDLSELFVGKRGRRPLSKIQKQATKKQVEDINNMTEAEAEQLYREYTIYDAELNIQVLSNMTKGNKISGIAGGHDSSFQSGQADVTVAGIKPTWNIHNTHNRMHGFAIGRGLYSMQLRTAVTETHIEVHSTKQPSETKTARQTLQELNDNTTSNLDDGDTQVAMMVGLLLRNPELTVTEARVFFPLYNDRSNAERKAHIDRLALSFLRAKQIARRVNRVLQAPNGSHFQSFYWDARLFIDKVAEGQIEMTHDTLLDFITELGVQHPGINFDETLKAEAEAALAAVTEHYVMERQPDLLTEISVDSRDIRSHENFVSKFPMLSKASLDIENGKNAGAINDRQARAMRSAVIKAVQYNPTILDNLNLEFSKKVEDAFAQKTGEESYVIRIGNQVINKADTMSVVYRFAHEIAHVGRIKFIEDNGEHYRKWRRLFLSKKGDTMLKKVITAFHNGSWTVAAQEEYNRVKQDKSGEEFIATMTGYYLVNDTLDILTSFDADEAVVYDETMTIVGKILSYVRRIMDRVSSVFIELRDTDPVEFENLTGLIKRTLGHEAARPDIGNRPTRRLYLEEHNVDPEVKDKEELTIYGLVERLDEIDERLQEIRIETALEEVGREANAPSIVELDSESEALLIERSQLKQEIGELGTEKQDPLGHNVIEYVRGLSNLRDQFSVADLESGEQLLDAEMIALNGSTAQKRIFLSYLMRRMTMNMVGKNGEFVANSLATMDNLPFFGHSTGLWAKVKNVASHLAVGSSGSNKTWNSPFTLIVMFSTLIDNSMSTMAGHWGNIEGIPSVMGAVGKIDQIGKEITTAMEVINKKVIGAFQAHLKTNEFSNKSKEASVEIRDIIAKEIWNKVNDGNYEYRHTKITGDPDIIKEADTIVKLYRNLKSIIDQKGVEVGLMQKGYEHMVPYRFAEGKNVKDETVESFVDGMGKVIVDRIRGSRSEGDLDKRRVDPFTLYAMKELPNIDDIVEGIEELENIKKTNRPLWEEIIATAIANNHIKIGKKVKGENRVQTIAKIKESGLVDTFFDGLNDTEAKSMYDEFIIPAVIEIMEFMAMPKNRFSAKYSGFGERSKPWWNRYYETVGSTSKRLKIFQGATRNHRFTHGRLIQGTSEQGKSGGAVAITTPASVHVSNVVVGAGQGVFFPQHWAIPPMHTVMDIKSIAGYLVWSPDVISQGIMRHVGNKIAEQSMFASHYGIRGTVGNMLNIAKPALASGNLLNSDGTIIAEQDRRNIVTAVDTLTAKYETIIGKSSGKERSPDEVLNFISKYAPDITRIVFGTNLTLATIVVENSMNMINELVGRGSITGFINAAVAPLMKLSPNIQKNVARDHAEIIRVFNSAFIPDFVTPDIDVRNSFIPKAMHWLGERNMHLAGIVHEMIATSRAVIFRGWLRDATVGGDSSKLKIFLEMHEKADKADWTSKNGRAQVARLMEKAGLPGTDAANVMYLMSEGILTSSNVDMMTEMIHESDGYYSLGDMLVEANTTHSAKDTDGLLDQKLEIIQGLRRAELQYIHEILVHPNPFDITTGNSSWDTFWEVFRRYPVLFASQQIGRRGPKFSLKRNAVHLASYAIVDSLYMTALLIAAGYPLEDILEGWKEDPVKQSVFMLFRLPHGGRYTGLIGELLANIVYGTQRQAFGFVPVGAAQSFMYNIKKMIEPLFNDDKDFDPASVAMFARIFPVIGDAITRILWFTVMGEEYQRQQTQSSKSSGSSKKWANYGSIYETSDVAQWSGIARTMLKELGWKGGSFNDLPPTLQKIVMDSMGRQQAAAVVQKPDRPVQPRREPVRASEKKDVVGLIQDAGRPVRAPEGLID